jgi:hypothetical protein
VASGFSSRITHHSSRITTPMAENSENIEAKLCAYVEGDLDEQGRVEIERHLEAHPNHRRLLAELTSTRDLLRYLPRENAPADLAETFNAQLERSALLDGPSVDPAVPKIHAANLLPRLLALAAIVVLGAGLGAVVYFGLPRGTSNTNYAAREPGGVPTDEDSAALTGSTSQPAIAHAERSLKAGSAAGEAPVAVVSETRRAMKQGKGGTGTVVAEGFMSKAGPGGGFGGARTEPVYLFVCATDLAAASREVTEQLSASNIAWQPADASAQIGQQQQQTLTNQVTSNAAGGFIDPARIELDNALKKKQQVLQSQLAQVPAARQYAQKAPATTQPRGGGNEAETAVANAEAKDKAGAAESNKVGAEVAVATPPAAPAAPAAPTASPASAPDAGATSQTPALELAKELDQQNQQQVPQPQQQAASQQQVLAQGQQNAQNVNLGAVNCYRAKMTREQVVNLGMALNRNAQQVELIADDQKLQRANVLLQQQQQQQGQQQQQQFARGSFDADALTADRSTVPQPTNRGASAAALAPVTQPVDNVQREEIARADASAARVAGKVATSGGPAAAADAAKGSTPAAGARPQSPISMKVGPNSKAVHSDAKAEPQQQQQSVATASPAPAPASVAPNASVAPPAAAAAPAQVAAKPSPVQMRYGNGARQAPIDEQKVARNSRLRVTVDELKGPDTSPTSEADVADDGTIGLPKLDQRVRVEGLTRTQAEQAIGDAYKAANVVDQPTVRVEPVPAAPPVAVAQRAPGDRDRSGDQQQAGVSQQETPPAGQSAAASSTRALVGGELGQPQAAPTSGPTIADEPIDVVILVQSSPAGASTEPGAPVTVENAPPNAAEPNQAAAPADAAKPAAPAENGAPNADAAPNASQNPAPPTPEPATPAPPPTPSELPAK